MMKKNKFLLYFLMIFMLIFVVGCGKKDKDSDKTTGSEATTEATIDLNNISTDTDAEKKPQKDADGYYITDDYVETVGETINVRVSPSLDADIYRIKEAGEVLKRTGYNDEWTRVLVDNSDFYISSEFVVETDAPVQDETENIGTDSDASQALDKKIVIDPGNQANFNVDLEELGPGSDDTKKGASNGNVGTELGTKEYELNLIYANLLKTELENRGYEVTLTRDTNDIDLSNKERAEIANQSGASVFVRIQMNYSENSELTGAMAVCMTEDSQFNSNLYNDSNQLASRLLQGIIEQTECVNHGIYETDRMTAINWSNIPVAVITLGYLSNADDEAKLISSEYQTKMINGIANGIEYYFAQ